MLQLLGLSVGEYVRALECAKAYLLLHPDDEDVLDNVDHYESLLDDGTDPGSVEAREVRPVPPEATLHPARCFGQSYQYHRALQGI